MKKSMNLSETLRVDCHKNETDAKREVYFVLVDEIYEEEVILTVKEMDALFEIVREWRS